MALLLTGSAQADCLRDAGRIETICGAGPCVRDRYGEVYCAPHIDGSAQLDRRGLAVCAAGQCARDIKDTILCSSQPGGAVLRNTYGDIDCFGGCAEATTAQCQREITGPRNQDGSLQTTPGQPPTGLEGYLPPGRSTR